MIGLATRHANGTSKRSMQERKTSVQRLAANLHTPQNLVHRQIGTQESGNKVVLAGIHIGEG